MPVDVLVGLQWGDEGKGKIVDLLTPNYDIVARFQGGPNAGHTLVINDKKYIFHTLPSGVICKNSINVLGSGMVVDPVTLVKEIETLKDEEIDIKGRVKISKRLHLILPTHKHLDAFHERRKADKKIGSTLRGISPCYQDKIGRNGITFEDTRQEDFTTKYNELKNFHLSLMTEPDLELLNKAENEWFEAVQYLQAFDIIDTEEFVNDKLEAGSNVLAEGAQGTLLDINFGTYPYVTSSHTLSSSACIGLGISPREIRKVYGVFKAYTTRVGEGPFTTELFDETGERMAKIGHEYGSTTGRRRRCGWLDLVALKYAVRLNGVTDLIITKSDVLSGFDELKVCTNYLDQNGEKLLFSDICKTDNIKPEYYSLKGWAEEIAEMKKKENLPENFNGYINYIEEYIETKITYISVGPERNQTITV
jgi:adenylosuccinate synthase